jgi:predicted alpha/beta-hydrolase family hydrolase
MQEHPVTSIKIAGYNARFVPHRFYRQSGETRLLSLIFPGLQYTCDMPVLYYPSLLLSQRRADVLHLYSDYTNADYTALPARQRAEWLLNDARAALKAGLAQRDYTHLVLVGKSIGSVAVAYLLQDQASHSSAAAVVENALTIWITPLLQQPQLITALASLRRPALLIASTADRTYDPASLFRIRQTATPEVLLIEGADHALEIPGDANASIVALQRLSQAVAAFLDRHLPA